jgi:hypothetical protein
VIVARDNTQHKYWRENKKSLEKITTVVILSEILISILISIIIATCRVCEVLSFGNPCNVASYFVVTKRCLAVICTSLLKNVNFLLNVCFHKDWYHTACLDFEQLLTWHSMIHCCTFVLE